MITLKNGRKAHRKCLDNFNSTIQCGIEHGGVCRDPECYFYEPAPPPPSWMVHYRERYWLFDDGLCVPAQPFDVTPWTGALVGWGEAKNFASPGTFDDDGNYVG